jgi:hypothetical protein
MMEAPICKGFSHLCFPLQDRAEIRVEEGKNPTMH